MKRYEVVKNYGYGGSREFVNLNSAIAYANDYSQKTGNPTYIMDWEEREEIYAVI